LSDNADVDEPPPVTGLPAAAVSSGDVAVSSVDAPPPVTGLPAAAVSSGDVAVASVDESALLSNSDEYRDKFASNTFSAVKFYSKRARLSRRETSPVIPPVIASTRPMRHSERKTCKPLRYQ